MSKFVFSALAITMIAGCFVGPSVESYAVSGTPYGAQVTIAVEGKRFDAELLAVRDSALLVLREREILLIPFQTITDATFARTAAGYAVTLSNGRPPTAEQAERLRLQSRYPQGVSPELERRLLTAYGQPAILVAGS
jgi:hypothetical protein